ncbi:MAG: mitofilin family membrane protein, partial [Pseudomonadota bacterium]
MAAELAERVAALETAEPEITGAEIEAALARIAALETAEPEITGAEIAALESRLSATEETLAAASARAEQAEALLEEARTEAQTLARRADMTSEMERITAAIDSGAAFDDALATLSEMVDSPPPEALSAAAGGDLASMASLITGFVPASQAALRADIAANASDSTLGQATAWLQSQVVSRPTEAQEGDGVAAILSRVDDALDAGDAPTALAEAEALPDAPKAALGGWLDQLRARAEAEAALSRWLAGIGTEQKG